MKISVVYHSGHGHTEVLAKAVSKGASSVDGAEVALLTAEEASANLESLTQSDAIIFGSPTYVGSVSGPFKTFMDSTSKIWFKQQWKDKIAAGFTNSGNASGDKLASLMQLALFAAQHSMHWVSLGINPGVDTDEGRNDPENLNRLGFWLGAASHARHGDPATEPPVSDLKTGKHLGRRVAETTKQWMRKP